MDEPEAFARKRKRHEIACLALARGDMHAVRGIARLIAEGTERWLEEDAVVLTGLVVTYARPFTKSSYQLKGRDEHGKGWERLPDIELQATHEALKLWRKKVFGHNDRNELRSIVVLPGVAWGTDKAIASEGWRLPKRDFLGERLINLTDFQFDRISAKLERLLPDAYPGDWPEGTILDIDGKPI